MSLWSLAWIASPSLSQDQGFSAWAMALWNMLSGENRAQRDILHFCQALAEAATVQV